MVVEVGGEPSVQGRDGGSGWLEMEEERFVSKDGRGMGIQGVRSVAVGETGEVLERALDGMVWEKGGAHKAHVTGGELQGDEGVGE